MRKTLLRCRVKPVNNSSSKKCSLMSNVSHQFIFRYLVKNVDSFMKPLQLHLWHLRPKQSSCSVPSLCSCQQLVLKLLEPGKSCSNKRFTDIWVKSFLNVHSYWNCTNFWLALRRTKERRRFRKILWPSQNIWTLIRPFIVTSDDTSFWFHCVMLVQFRIYFIARTLFSLK